MPFGTLRKTIPFDLKLLNVKNHNAQKINLNFQIRFQAFTLVELMITLVLAGVIVFAALQVLTLTGLAIRAFEDQSSQAIQLTACQTVLQQDFLMPGVKQRTSSGITCQNDELIIRYEFSETATLRFISGNDFQSMRSFPVAIHAISSFANGKRIESGIIDRLDCVLETKELMEKCTFQNQCTTLENR